MSRRLAFAAAVGACAFAISCRGGPAPEPIPDNVPGSYVYSAKGSALDKLSWQIAANLDLKPDGTFELTLDKTVNGEKDSTERTSGTYSVSGGKIWIAGGDLPRGSHGLVIRPDSLVGEVGWKDHLVLRGLGIPDPVFVRRRQI